FKPENVLVADDGRVLVTDFGLARETFDEESFAAAAADESAGANVELTATGALLGTPAYMAPEHHLGATVDARSDIFAFAIALWEGLYRQHPFQAEGRLQMVY
ncbi:MAG: protein kinase, partial [Myxococcales bacterium]|nr:protein kinase [Myxococcales bacterium]